MGPVEVAQQTGAGTVVTGSYYEVGDSLRVSAQVVDAASGRILAAFPSLTAPRQHPEQALAPLRDRAMGTFAVLMDQRLPPAAAARSRPPTYEAYLAFDAGLRRFVNQDYTGAIPELRKAVTLDTFFMSPRMTIAASWWNEGRMDSVGVVLEELRVRRSALSPLLALSFDALDAWYHNDLQRAYELHTEAARRAPDSQAGYNLAFTALAIDRPADALRILDGLDPSSGALRDWSSYWTQLAHALHMTGNHARELEAARELARRFPSRRVALTLEVRALAAVRDTSAIDSVLNESLSLPPSTYWSQGSAMVMAGEELLAHGYPASAGRYFERAIQWCREQLALDPGFRNHREWLATALYDTGRWREAHEVFTALAREYPTSRHYLGWTALTTARTTGQDRSEAFSNPAPWARASNLLTRGRIAAARRERDRARLLLTEAVGLGIEGLPWLHATAARDLLELGTDRTLLPSSLRAGLPLAAH
jgi:tetratricopeptide (TPR) repeat protein